MDTSNSFTFDTTGEVPATGQLNLIPQGVAESERVGRKVTIKSIMMHGTMTAGVAGTGGQTVRMLLVQDTQCNGAATTYATVMNGTNTWPFRNLDNIDRFRVLKDWKICLNAQAGVAGAWQPTKRFINFYKKCNIPIEFDNTATTGAITTIRSNNLFLLAIADSDDDVTNYTGVTRIRYTDN